MPSTSAKQAKFMRAVAHSPKFAKKVGVPQSVGKDFSMADKKKKTKKFGSGGWGMDLPRKDGSSIEKLPTKMPSKDGSDVKKLPTKMPSKDGSGIKKFNDGGDTARAKKLKGPGPARPLEFPIRGSSISIPLDEERVKKLKKPANAPKMVDFEPRQPKTGKAPANAPKPFEMTRGPDITVKGKSDRDEARKYREDLKKVKVSPAEGRVIESANRSEGGGGMKKGGMMMKATKAGRAMTKKSADTMGRAMVKKAGGGKCYAKGGTASARADGIAKKGKTKGKEVKMALGGSLGSSLSGMGLQRAPVAAPSQSASMAAPRGALQSVNRMPSRLGSGESAPSGRMTQSASGNPGQVMRANASRNPQNRGSRVGATGRKKGGMVGKKKGGKC